MEPRSGYLVSAAIWLSSPSMAIFLLAAALSKPFGSDPSDSLLWVVRDSLSDLVAKLVYHCIGSLSSCFCPDLLKFAGFKASSYVNIVPENLG